MRYINLLLLLIYVCPGYAQKVSNRIIMIGNFSEAAHKKDFIEAIKNSVTLDEETTILYLGNNVSSSRDTASLRIAASLADNTAAKMIFVPGYAEWKDGREGGYRSVSQLQKYVKNLRNENIRMYPEGGCPGPVNIDLKEKTELFIMDSQWWLHEHSKPDIESDCRYRTKEEILAEIEDIPKDHFDKLVLFVTHHPMINTGVHSGKFGIKQHIFPLTDIRSFHNFYLPLPLIGSLYPITRNAITTKQDMNNYTYHEMAEKGIGTLAGIRAAFDSHPNTIFISAQEHSAQLIHAGRQYQIISGTGNGGGRVTGTHNTEFLSNDAGFSVLEITDEKKVTVTFYNVKGNKATEKYKSDIINYASLPPLAADTARMPLIQQDSFSAAVNKRMAEVGGLKKLLVGENYRQEWATDVKMKVFRINEEKGGMTMKGIGGGHESKSLQMEDKAGNKWVLRSINKDLSPVTPEGFQETVADDLVHDLLSGVHPYAALIVPGIQEPLGIVHAKAEVVFIPNDTALGEYRPVFANTVMQLEERKPSLNANSTHNTNEAINDMVKDSDPLMDQRTYLKARLVDFLFSDYDRHHGQWSWGTIDTAGRTMYYPIPKDRDQALYHNQGLIMDVGRRQGYAFMTNFRSDIADIKNMGLVGAYMDMFFTNALTKTEWQQVLNEFSTTLTDSVIIAAIHRLPPEIYAIRGQEIQQQMIRRRDMIAEKGMDYYSFISKKVNILGGNKQDVFKVEKADDGVAVSVFALDNGTPELRYYRIFDPAVTDEIRLYGFNGADYFDIDESVKKGIRFRIVGGKGVDTFDIKGNPKNFIYDLSFEDNQIVNRKNTYKFFSNNPDVNAYEFREQLHNTMDFPIITGGFNPDDRILVGVGASFKRLGFRKYPYASKQSISTMIAISRRAYQVRYGGEFNHAVRNFDLLINAEVYNPALNNFYGFGNETKLDNSKKIDYYRTRFNYISGDLMLRKRFLNDSVVSISFGPTVYNYWYNETLNQDRILENPATVGLDDNRIRQHKLYGGGKMLFKVNNLNNDLVPVRGISWISEFTMQAGLNNNAQTYTRLTSALDLYAELSPGRKLLAAIHLGGGHIFSEDFEYFQALTLGANNYLRGYRRNRFSGSSMVYAGADLKFKLFDLNTRLLKSDIGLVAFNDFGRVWLDGEISDKWHHGYGGGLYIIPYEYLMLSAVIGLSEEDQLLNISLGTKINLVY